MTAMRMRASAWVTAALVVDGQDGGDGFGRGVRSAGETCVGAPVVGSAEVEVLEDEGGVADGVNAALTAHLVDGVNEGASGGPAAEV